MGGKRRRGAFSDSEDDDSASIPSKMKRYQQEMNKKPALEELPPVPLSDLRTKYCKYDQNCWGCIHNFGPAILPGKYLEMEKLYTFFELNYKTMNIRQLRKGIFLEWNRLVYKPQLELNENPVYWSEEMIETHLLFHMNGDDDFRILRSLDNCKILKEHVGEFVIRGEGTIDNKAGHLFAVLTKLEFEGIKTHQTMKG